VSPAAHLFEGAEAVGSHGLNLGAGNAGGRLPTPIPWSTDRQSPLRHQSV
jgi:hypothetical protein